MRKRSLCLLYVLGFTEIAFAGFVKALPFDTAKLGVGMDSILSWCSKETRMGLFHSLVQCKPVWFMIAFVGLLTIGVAALMTVFTQRLPEAKRPQE